MTEVPQYVLHPDEATILLAARRTLDAIQERCSAAAGDTPHSRRSFDLGKVHEAADAAEKAIFGVLNVASSYAACRVSANALDRASGRVPRYPDPVIGDTAAPADDDQPAGGGLTVVES